MTTTGDAAPQFAPGQFSLAGMLSAFLGCGIYFGLLTAATGLGRILAEPGSVSSALVFWTIVLSWGGLWALYNYWNLKAAFVIHYTGPLACGILAAVIIVASLPFHAVGDALQPSLFVLLYGPFISVLFGFPVVVIMLVYRVLKRN